MTVSPIMLYKDEVIDVTSIITENGKFTVLTGPEIRNTSGANSIALAINYKDIHPDPASSSPGYKLVTTIEAKAEDLWLPIGYQFEPFRFISQGL